MKYVACRHSCLPEGFKSIADIDNKARQYLEASQWDFASAMTTYYNPPEETAESQESQDEDMPNAHVPSSTPAITQPDGGRRLGEGTPTAQPIPSSTSSQSSRPPKRAAAQQKFATLGDFGNDSHGHDDPNDSDYNDDKHDLFAGGEKSGLAVQNPDDLKKKILEKARK
jgi:UBX domain-containing protein 1